MGNAEMIMGEEKISWVSHQRHFYVFFQSLKFIITDIHVA